MVRSIAQQTDAGSLRSTANTPMPWDRPTQREEVQDDHSRLSASARDSRDSQRMRIERLGLTGQHSRNNSGNSGEYSTHENAAPPRRHDYDLHAMETNVTEQARMRDSRFAAPSPIVTVRSEFPTITRSNLQQSLTCLVTIEIPEMKKRPIMEDFQSPISPPAQHSDFALAPAPLQPPRFTPQPTFISNKSIQELNQLTADLRARVDNWHGLEFSRFGNLKLHGTIRVGKDQRSWQELECYLFGEMLICVKEKRNALPPLVTEDGRRLTRCTLKGSILIKKHLKEVHVVPDAPVLTLNLSVAELPTFHLSFSESAQLAVWRSALLDLHNPRNIQPPNLSDYEHDLSGTDDEFDRHGQSLKRQSSAASSFGGARSAATTAPTEYSSHKIVTDSQIPPSLHTPLDIVVVIPVSSSMQGLKISILKDTLRFLVSNLGERDRMGLVSFGSGQGGVPLVGMTAKSWPGWNKVLSSIRPVGQKSLRADVVEGANVAMDLLMQRKAANPISSILLISDSSISDTDSVNFVVSRAEAAKVGMYSFGLGLTHKPDSMIELSTRTKASYTYVKDWMMLRECVAGCLGSLQSISHQNAKLRLKLPEGSPAKFVKISGAMQTTKRATGREAEASLGELRYGDKRDILVQLVIDPDITAAEQLPQDHWETIVSGLEALGGSNEVDESRVQSIEEVPLLQADLSFMDLSTDDAPLQFSRPSLLTITMLPTTLKTRSNGRPMTPPIPPHPHIVQRRMELLTSDMLTRALTLVAKQHHDRAFHLLTETRTILKGLAKGGLPPLPPAASAGSGISKRGSPPAPLRRNASPATRSETGSETDTPIPRSLGPPTSTVDPVIMNALDADIEAALEWINHPAVFSRDSRKAVLQAIGIVSSQRAYTFRTATESIWAERISGVRKLTDAARGWREVHDELLAEEQ